MKENEIVHKIFLLKLIVTPLAVPLLTLHVQSLIQHMHFFPILMICNKYW